MRLGGTVSVIASRILHAQPEHYNFGGKSQALRWMLLGHPPFWGLAALPALDLFCQARWSPGRCCLAFGLSAFSAWYPADGPWTSPWIYSLMERHGGGSTTAIPAQRSRGRFQAGSTRFPKPPVPIPTTGRARIPLGGRHPAGPPPGGRRAVRNDGTPAAGIKRDPRPRGGGACLAGSVCRPEGPHVRSRGRERSGGGRDGGGQS